MNIQKAIWTLVVALFTAASIQSVAFAKAKDEDDDSVRSWGRWATLVQPAAGPPAANVALAGLGLPIVEIIPEPPVPPVPVPADGCDAGALCGYGVIGQSRIQISLVNDPLNTVNGPQLATPGLEPRPVFVLPPLQLSGPVSNGIFAPPVPITLTIDSNSTPGLGLNLTGQNVFIYPVSPVVTEWGFFEISGSNRLDIRGVTLDLGTLFAYGTIFEEVTAPVVFPDLFDQTITRAAFIVGETSSLVDVAAAEAAVTDVSAGTAVASYSGFTLLSNSTVDISVDFGNDSFIATVNGGTDGIVSEQLNSDGSTSLIGNVGFVASGDIVGVNIVANNISATDASAISGDFVGSFFGDEAGVLAGTADIDKTTADVDGNYTDAYVTAKDIELPNLQALE